MAGSYTVNRATSWTGPYGGTIVTVNFAAGTVASPTTLQQWILDNVLVPNGQATNPAGQTGVGPSNPGPQPVPAAGLVPTTDGAGGISLQPGSGGLSQAAADARYLQLGSGAYQPLGTNGLPTVAAPGPAYNVTADKFPNTRLALAKLLNGTADLNLVGAGNSRVRGLFGAQLGFGWPDMLRALLAAAGYPAANGLITSNTVGDPGIDPRINGGSTPLPSGWTQLYSAGLGFFFGGDEVAFNGAVGASNLVITPGNLWDTIDVYTGAIANGNGTLQATATGGSAVGNNGAVPTSIVKSTASAASALKTNTVTLGPISGNQVRLLGVVPRLASTKQILVHNAGVGANQLVNMVKTTAPYGAVNGLASLIALNPALTIIHNAINDEGLSGLSASAWIAALQTAVTALQAAGSDVLVVSEPPENSGGSYSTNTASLNPQYQAALIASGIPTVDCTSRFTPQTSFGGFYYSDKLHFLQAGYADIAMAIFQALRSGGVF